MFSGYCLAAMSQFKGKNQHGKRCLSRLQLSVILLVMTNVPMALYMSLFHQVSFPYFNIVVLLYTSMDYFCCFSIISIYITYSDIQHSLWQRGTEDVMYYLSKEAHDGRVKSVLFLMPCHSTPYYSSLHYNLPMRFLDCTPRWVIFFVLLNAKIFNLSYLYSCLNTYVPVTLSTALSDNKGTLDESDLFLTSPFEFVGEVFGNLSTFSHIVLFESEERHVLQLLMHNSFLEVIYRCTLDNACFLFHFRVQ
jgi:phosphatidylinositol glycan class B